MSRSVLDTFGSAPPTELEVGADLLALGGAIARMMPDWFEDAACAGAPAEAFFPERGHAADALECPGCPVRDQCLDYAIAYDIRVGWWGGMSPKARAKLARDRDATEARRS